MGTLESNIDILSYSVGGKMIEVKIIRFHSVWMYPNNVHRFEKYISGRKCLYHNINQLEQFGSFEQDSDNLLAWQFSSAFVQEL